MARSVLCFALASATIFGAKAQLVLRPNGVIERPPGAWADTVLITFDPQVPIGSMRYVDATGDVHSTHAVFDAHPSLVLKGMLGPGLKAPSEVPAQVLKVNRLVVDEVGTKAVCLFHAEVLEVTGERYVPLFEQSVTIQSERCGKKTDCHESNIRKALQDFMGDYRQVTSASLRKDVLRSRPDEPFNVTPENTPVLAGTQLKRGLYHTYMQFRMNVPDSMYEFDVKGNLDSTSTEEVIRLKHMPGSVVEQYWGVSDGTHAYVRVGRSFVRLHPSRSGFTALVPQPASIDQSVMMAGIMFGAIGGAIAGAAALRPMPPIQCELNMLCGDLVPLDPALLVKDYAANVFYVSRFAKNDSPISITCEGMQPVQLEKRQWTTLQMPPQASARSVIINGAQNSETIPITTNSDKVYVYLIDIKKDGSLKVNELNEQMRMAVLDGLKPEDKRP